MIVVARSATEEESVRADDADEKLSVDKSSAARSIDWKEFIVRHLCGYVVETFSHSTGFAMLESSCYRLQKFKAIDVSTSQRAP
jgi:hypothetical protein